MSEATTAIVARRRHFGGCGSSTSALTTTSNNNVFSRVGGNTASTWLFTVNVVLVEARLNYARQQIVGDGTSSPIIVGLESEAVFVKFKLGAEKYKSKCATIIDGKWVA